MVNLFQNHSRSFEHNRYVYPVVSRRARGLSIGVDPMPRCCSFRCIYCSEFGALAGPPPEAAALGAAPAARECGDIDLDRLRRELEEMLAMILGGEIFAHPPFGETPAAYRRLNDIALSGSGEPTLSPAFEEVCALIRELGEAVRGAGPGRWPSPKAVLITNATALHLPAVQRGIDALGKATSEIWAKLDAGTPEHYAAVNRSRVCFEQVLDNLLMTGRRRGIVIQALFGEIDGRPPEAREIEAWLGRLANLRAGGARIDGVQVYTVARATPQAAIRALPDQALQAIARRAEALGFTASWFGSGA